MFQKQIPTFKLLVNGTEEEVDPNPDLQIYDGDLITEFSEQPGKYAYYGGLYADAASTLDEYKVKINQYKADIEPLIRQRFAERFGDKEKLTEAKTESEYDRDEQLQLLRQGYLNQERIVRRLEVLKKAFEQRSQMLYNIGSFRVQELKRLMPDKTEE